MRWRRRLLWAALPFFALGASACGIKDDRASAGTRSDVASGSASAAARPAVPLPPPAQAALDAGNEAVRRKDYATALSRFEEAAKLAPDHAAPWFGIYIVAQARNDTKAADAALVEIRKRSDR